ncbi:MAG TPA: hypothetical protein PK493_15105, partial [Pseudomonadota bacterium]|nr:hypothetical protein [Pseudomonadota bacterium]
MVMAAFRGGRQGVPEAVILPYDGAMAHILPDGWRELSATGAAQREIETLARLEARCMFDELLRRITAPEVSGPVVRMHSNLVNGYKQLPLCFRPR